MNPDRLVELVLERRFGTAAPEDLEALETALRADPGVRAEAERVEALLSAAPGALVDADPAFAARLSERIAEVEGEEARPRWGSLLRRAVAAYAGIAAGAVVSLLLRTGEPTDVAGLRLDAALEAPPAARGDAPSRPSGR